jgi:hypothetical protein
LSGADEAMVGHENCYKLYWPKKRTGFARVAMAADALLVPFFTRNAEESRWNLLHDIWHLLRLYVPVQWLVNAKIPVVSSVMYTIAEVVWFFSCAFSIPIPVRSRVIFGKAVPYKSDEPVDVVVSRCHTALQTLINETQPNASEGRNYTRALVERWDEDWTVSYPKITSALASCTPQTVARWLRRIAAGGNIPKKAQ